ncbi:MAG: hypothetical protein WB729_11385 [Candidatus Sulfotelmatobacter sp.]
MPSECSGDGTAFLYVLLPAVRKGPTVLSSSRVPDGPPIELLVSIARSGEAHEFRLDQITDLYDVHQKGYYASESNVGVLVIAATEDKWGPREFVTSDGTKHEVNRSLAEHHDHLLIFDRAGNYKRRVQIDDTLAINRIGMFPSGVFLALGFDRQDHSPKLAMLQEDGTLLKFLEIPKDDAPKSMLGTQDGGGRGPAVFVAPAQLVPDGDSIVIVQNKSKFPLLEVNEAGAVRVIKPDLPEGVQIDKLIPSDGNLYARVNEQGSIYELNAQTGKTLRHLQIGDHEPDVDVVCVHDGKFLSFEHEGGELVPLVGTAEPATDVSPTDPRMRTSHPPSNADNR